MCKVKFVIYSASTKIHSTTTMYANIFFIAILALLLGFTVSANNVNVLEKSVKLLN